MRCVLGFDGGGTKTECVLMAESGEILARTRSGPSNPSRVGTEAAITALIDAADQALAASGTAESAIVSICGGVAGINTTQTSPEFTERLSAKFPNATVAIYSDLNMTLAATNETPSVVVIAGTGSAVLGRSIAGESVRDGGFGPVLGDPGSAYDIGRKAVIAALRRDLAREVYPLGTKMLELFRCNWTELQEQIRHRPDSVLPKIFPLVVEAAEEGDELARAALISSAEELAQLVQNVVHRLHLSREEFFLAKTGGVFDRSRFFDDSFDASVRQIAPGVRIGLLPKPIAEFAAHAAVECLERPRVRADQ